MREIKFFSAPLGKISNHGKTKQKHTNFSSLIFAMNKPHKNEKCSPRFNMRPISPDRRDIRILCLYAKHRDLIKSVLESVGGSESSGICEEHFEWAVFDSNQPETEDQRKRREEFERRKEEAMRKAKKTA